MISDEYPYGHPMVAQVAIQQGRLLAKNLLSQLEGKPLKKFSYNDKGSLATIGKRKAVADIGKFKFGGYFAWLLWSGVHLMSISGFKKDRKSTRLNSSHVRISYAVFCLKKKTSSA